MSLPGFEELFAVADSRRPAVGVAVAGGADDTVLTALRAARDRGWIVPWVAGSERAIRATADAAAINLDGFTILDSEQPAVTAVAAVRSGQARLLMKGQIATPLLLKAMLDPEHGLRTGRVICQVVLMELPRDRRRFLLTDTGITLRPTLEQKLDILRSAVAVAHGLGASEPRVAALAASESVNPQMPETVDAADLQRRSQAGEIDGCVVQGPLSFDLAFAADAADKKRIAGSVPGAADVLLFPDLLSANLTVKAIMYTAECAFGGILAGAAVPVVFMSRADTTATRLRSLALALAALDR